ncbi:MAG: hypothetical protein ACOX6T_01195 [Myxococcales bacterium]
MKRAVRGVGASAGWLPVAALVSFALITAACGPTDENELPSDEEMAAIDDEHASAKDDLRFCIWKWCKQFDRWNWRRPGTTDPGTTDPGTDPGTTDPGTTDPGTTDPGTDDPGTTDPGTNDPSGPSPTLLPRPSGACPNFATGDLTFSPAGIPARKVRIWMNPSAAASLDGPVVFYWHGTGSSPSEALSGLGQGVIDQITALGGIVAAPYSDPDAGLFPWFLVTSRTRLDDLVLADEVVACAKERIGIDVRRVHSLGMSAGGLQTTQMSYRRSGYIASVATYSGGLNLSAPATQDSSNRFAALIFHGGTNDQVFINFLQASERYWQDLSSRGHFAAICNHGRSHSIPTDARASVWEFFKAHPFGVRPSPYANGLPASFPSYCDLSP